MFIFNKKYIRSRPLLTGTVLGGVLLVSTLLSILLVSPTFARMTTDDKPSDRAASYSYLKGLGKCVKDHMRSSIQTVEGADGATSPSQYGNVWNGVGGGPDGSTHGEWFDDLDAWVVVYPDGRQDCAQVASKAIELWDFTGGKEFLQNMGYVFDSERPAWVRSNQNADTRLLAFNSSVRTKVGDVDTLLNNAAKYALYLGAFASSDSSLSDCDARQLGVLSTLDTTQQNAAKNNESRNGRTYTVIKLYDASTNGLVEYAFTYLKSGDGGISNTASVWNYRGANYPGGNGEIYTCEDLVNKIKANATAFWQWNRANPTNEDSNPGFTPGGTAGESCVDDASCEETATTCAIDGWGWLICPGISFLATIADASFDYLSGSFLQVDTKVVSPDSATYTAWVVMRNVANVAFVIAFLFIIFSQLTGQGIANYGIKKMLPRLVVAAILVNLSFIICQLAVDISNILGYSLNQVFQSIGGSVITGDTRGSESGNWVGIAATVLAGGAIAWGLGVAVLLPFLVGAVIALMMIFLILVIRQVLIILLVVLAPIAFVAFLLPNTEQLFTKWRKVFVALLLIFPMIGLLFGASGLAADILRPIYAEKGDVIGQIIAAAVVALPLFLLPALLKGSLDAVPAIGKRLRGATDKFSKGARNKTAGSGVMKSLANRRARTRAQIGAGVYSGSNPVNKARSRINSALNKSSAYNAVTGDYGTMRGATINRLEDEETKMAEAAVQLKARGSKGTSEEEQFAKAIARNDIVAAKAAQNVLMKSGGPGVASARNVTNSTHKDMTQAMREALADNVTENHAQIAKAKSNDFLMWAAGGGTTDVDSVSSQARTWAGLNASELASQRDESFVKALNSGGISAETIEAISSSRMSENLTQGKREALKSYRERGIASIPKPGDSQSTAQSGTQQTTTQVDPLQQQTPRSDPSQLADAQTTIQTSQAQSRPTLAQDGGAVSPDGGLSIPHDKSDTTEGSTPATTPETTPEWKTPQPEGLERPLTTAPDTPTSPAQPAANDQNPSTNGPDYPDNTPNKAP